MTTGFHPGPGGPLRCPKCGTYYDLHTELHVRPHECAPSDLRDDDEYLPESWGGAEPQRLVDEEPLGGDQ